MYVEEYYEDENKKQFTRRNYNSPDSSCLSLTNGVHNGIPFHSISLNALYVSKSTERKKDIYDRSIMADYVDKNVMKRIVAGISIDWEEVDGIPGDIIKLSCISRENKNGFMFTKERV